MNPPESTACFVSKGTVVLTNSVPKRSGLADIPDSALYNESIDAAGPLKEDDAM